jgi:hypothetical protein
VSKLERPDHRQTVTVSYSELSTFRDCPLKHALAYKQRWTKEPQPGSALAKGSLWHEVMAAHYGEIKAAQLAAKQDTGSTAIPGDRHKELLEDCRDAVMPLLHEQGEMTEDQQLVLWMYDGYVEYYGIDPQWEIVAIEHRGVVPLLTDEGKKSRFRLKIIIDLVVRDRPTGKLHIIDHKSAKDLEKKQELDLDDQFGLYVAGLRAMGRKVFMAVHSGARTYRLKDPTKQALEDRFRRTPMFRTDVELTNIMVDAWRTAKQAYSANNRVPYSSPNPSQCKWKCDFLDAHLGARKGIPIEQSLRDFGFTRQPLNRH